jgi:hypothetical protein
MDLMESFGNLSSLVPLDPVDPSAPEKYSFMVDVEPDSKSGSVGVSHTPSAWLLSIMDFLQPYCSFVDQWIEPYSNAWALQVLNLKVHEKAPHVEIESSLNPMDSLQGCLLLEVWFVTSWASAEALVLASYLAVLPAYFHVQNLSVWNHL